MPIRWYATHRGAEIKVPIDLQAATIGYDPATDRLRTDFPDNKPISISQVAGAAIGLGNPMPAILAHGGTAYKALTSGDPVLARLQILVGGVWRNVTDRMPTSIDADNVGLAKEATVLKTADIAPVVPMRQIRNLPGARFLQGPVEVEDFVVPAGWLVYATREFVARGELYADGELLVV